jgi:hypothetical protein
MLTYRNPGPVAFYSERYAPVPGWGMCPNMAGPSVIGIGAYQPKRAGSGRASFIQARPTGAPGYYGSSYAPGPGYVGSPGYYGGKRPLRGLGYDLVIKAPAPIGNHTISIPIEDMAKKAADAAVAAAWPAVKQKIEGELPVLLATAEKSVVNELWPQMQPKLRAEVDYALAQGKKTAALVGLAVVVAIAISAMWVKKGK